MSCFRGVHFKSCLRLYFRVMSIRGFPACVCIFLLRNFICASLRFSVPSPLPRQLAPLERCPRVAHHWTMRCLILLLFKLSAHNEFNTLRLFPIRIFMDPAGRVPQKHARVAFDLKHCCRGVLLNGGQGKSFPAPGLPCLAALCPSPSPECTVL